MLFFTCNTQVRLSDEGKFSRGHSFRHPPIIFSIFLFLTLLYFLLLEHTVRQELPPLPPSHTLFLPLALSLLDPHTFSCLFSRFIYHGAVFDSKRVSGRSVSAWMVSGLILSPLQYSVAVVGRLPTLIFWDLASPPAQDGSSSSLQLLCHGK